VPVLHFWLWLLHQYPGLWHILAKSTLMSSHLHSLQTFSVSGVDSIQPYQLLYLASKTSIGIYGTKKRLVSRNILMDHGCRPEKAAVFRFYTPWHGAAPVVHCSFRAAFRVRDRKAPRSRTSRIACSTNRATFRGAQALYCRNRVMFSIRNSE